MYKEIKINKYLPIAILYFFLNGFLLPNGLLYTTLLTPLFLVWLFKFQVFKYLKFFFLFTLPFLIIHLVNGVDIGYYARSYILLFSVFVFVLSFYQFLKICQSLRIIYRDIVLINFVLTLFALIALFIPALHEALWLKANISGGIEGVSRLRLFTYEPSYYSTLLVPVLVFYFLRSLIEKRPSLWLMVIAITFSIILSFSFGVISALFFSLSVLLLINVRRFFSKPTTAIYVLSFVIILLIAAAALLILFPDNILVRRFHNVLQGRDSSFRGRTYDAFYLGWKITEMKSVLFGSGLGQTKVLGLDLWRNYYAYNFSINQIAIPNVIGDTLAVFGLVGVAIRLGLEVFFFFRTKVYTNYYRLALFSFIFVYQFTGSFLYNIAEYVIWILAFVNVFEEFDKPKMRKLSA